MKLKIFFFLFASLTFASDLDEAIIQNLDFFENMEVVEYEEEIGQYQAEINLEDPTSYIETNSEG